MKTRRLIDLPWLYALVAIGATVILFARGHHLELGPVTLPLGEYFWGIVGGVACALGCSVRRAWIGVALGTAWALGWFTANGGSLAVAPEWIAVIGAGVGLGVAVLGFMTIAGFGPIAHRTRGGST